MNSYEPTLDWTIEATQAEARKELDKGHVYNLYWTKMYLTDTMALLDEVKRLKEKIRHLQSGL